ncbi:MAG: glycosyltransferase family 2 protein [Prevotella sp.]|nr:glycosyltransferase family 2 protein [Prevotella sp.]
MEKNILYTIITPVYNRADCIRRCMESVERSRHLLNGHGGVEHVIVDDGSSDSTRSIIEEYAKQHSHIVFVKFNHNRGTNAARNEAIKRAQGEWCIILDSDDYFMDNALTVITDTMKNNSGYKHYMFAPNDMQTYFQTNEIINGAKEKVILYPDFLNGYIGGDFIHVCNTAIMRKYPFNETIRIHEGVFFLMFYREARQMLFTNKTVTIRERSRADSVTRDTIRTRDSVINNIILSKRILLHNFEDDMINLGMSRRLNAIKTDLCENLLLMSRYSEASELHNTLKGKIPDWKYLLFTLLTLFHCGRLYKITLQLYLNMRYNVMKKKLK